MGHVGRDGTGSSSLEERERNYHCYVTVTVLSTVHTPFNPLNSVMLVLFLLHLQIGKLRHHVIRKLTLLSVVEDN